MSNVLLIFIFNVRKILFALILSFLIFLKDQLRSVLHINLTLKKKKIGVKIARKTSKERNTSKIGNNLLLQYFSTRPCSGADYSAPGIFHRFVLS